MTREPESDLNAKEKALLQQALARLKNLISNPGIQGFEFDGVHDPALLIVQILRPDVRIFAFP